MCCNDKLSMFSCFLTVGILTYLQRTVTDLSLYIFYSIFYLMDKSLENNIFLIHTISVVPSRISSHSVKSSLVKSI